MVSEHAGRREDGCKWRGDWRGMDGWDIPVRSFFWKTFGFCIPAVGEAGEKAISRKRSSDDFERAASGTHVRAA
jgi:hypothetical protein